MKLYSKNILLLFIIYIVSFPIHSQNFWQGVPGPTGTVNHYAINSTGYIFIVGGCGALRSTDDGESWTGVQPSNFGEISITINSSDHVFVGTDGDGIYKSTNNGGSWTQINNGLTNLYVYSLATHPSGDLYAGLSIYLFRSTDNGNTLFSSNLNASSIVSLDVNASRVIFAGTNGSGVYKSTDNGTTWTVCYNGLTNPYVFTLNISPNNDIYVGTVNGGAFRSTDEGNSWMQIGLTGHQVQCFAFTPNGDVFSGTNDGVFKSTDNGGTWTHISSNGLNNPYVYCLFFNSAGYLFAGTGIDLCRSVEPVITSIDDSFSETQQSFILYQNYPNPFNPSTKIRFVIPSPINRERNLEDFSSQTSRNDNTLVTLKVYDVLGNEVATLVNEYKPAGSYEVEFNVGQHSSADISSGVYFYQLKVTDTETNSGQIFIQTKKMILIR